MKTSPPTTWKRNSKETPDGLFSVEAVRCLGCCGLAPVVVVNGEVYGKLSKGDVAGIIEKYRKLG